MSSHGGGAQGGRGTPTNRQERIYSSQQLILAMRSGLAAVKDQMQVLAILDGTAASWPGVNQALDDMEALVGMSAQTTSNLEDQVAKAAEKLEDCRSEVHTLKETVALANATCEELQATSQQHLREAHQVTAKLDLATKEINQQRQEVWTLEKQRADLASELEKYKQDNEFMEGEITTLRATVLEQGQQLTVTKEELAARKADVQHLGKTSTDLRAQNADLKKQLELATASLRAVQSDLEALRGDKARLDKDNARLSEENARTGAELAKLLQESQRAKDWAEVVKKVENDKLRDEQAAHLKTKVDFEQARVELEKTIARLTAELNNKEQQTFTKTAEASNASKQVGLLNIQMRDMQKQLAQYQAEKAGVLKERDASKAEAAKMQQKVQQLETQIVNMDKARAAFESKTKEQGFQDRARLQAAIEEARKEGAVNKALADGWSRDLKDMQSRLQTETHRCAVLQEKLDNLTGLNNSQDGNSQQNQHMEMVKQVAVMEQQVKDLKGQISAKEVEMRKVKAESLSLQKGLEKQLERLQRECNESAAEIQRLKASAQEKLPQIQGRPQSLQDDLDHLKRFMNQSGGNFGPSGGNGSPGALLAARLPNAMGGSNGKVNGLRAVGSPSRPRLEAESSR